MNSCKSYYLTVPNIPFSLFIKFICDYLPQRHQDTNHKVTTDYADCTDFKIKILGAFETVSKCGR